MGLTKTQNSVRKAKQHNFASLCKAWNHLQLFQKQSKAAVLFVFCFHFFYDLVPKSFPNRALTCNETVFRAARYSFDDESDVQRRFKILKTGLVRRRNKEDENNVEKKMKILKRI